MLSGMRRPVPWLRFCLAIGLAWVSSLPFAQPGYWRTGLVLTGAFLFFLAMRQWTGQRQARQMMEQYQVLMAYLSSRLAVGETLERALLGAGPAIDNQLASHSPLRRGLRQLDRQIRAQVDLEQALNALLDRAVCPPVRPFLSILPHLRQMGGQMDAFVRNSHRMLAEQIALEQDIAAEQSQKSAEALILMILPFALAAILGGSADGYAQMSLQQASGKIGMALAYLLACLAVVWTIYLLGNPTGNRATSDQPGKPTRGRVNRLQQNLSKGLRNLYQSRYLGHWGALLLGRIEDRNWQATDSITTYMNQKIVYLLAGSCLGLGWSIISWLPPAIFWLPGLLFSGLQDAQAWNAWQQRKNQYRLAYPAFLNWIVVLLQAGFSLDKTLTVAAQAWLPQRARSQNRLVDRRKVRQRSLPFSQAYPGHQLIAADLHFLQQQQQAGRPCTWILGQLAEKNPIIEVQSTLHMLVRYDREGGRELLDLLAMQTANSWNLQRNGLRKALEIRSLQLLLPMMIDLVVVLFIAILPAMLMLSI